MDDDLQTFDEATHPHLGTSLYSEVIEVSPPPPLKRQKTPCFFLC